MGKKEKLIGSIWAVSAENEVQMLGNVLIEPDVGVNNIFQSDSKTAAFSTTTISRNNHDGFN